MSFRRASAWITLALLLTLQSNVSYAVCSALYPGWLDIDAWMDSQVKVVGADIAYNQDCGTSGLSLRAGLTFYANEADVYKGLTFSVRKKIKGPVQPFVGLGVFGGEGFFDHSTLANHDGIDNDNDGVIDEPGEMETTKSLSMYAYPELGFIVEHEGFGFTMSARQYWGLGDGAQSAVVYNIGWIYVFK